MLEVSEVTKEKNKGGRPVIGKYKVNLTLSKEIGSLLEEIANENGQSVSSVVRNILDKKFKKK